MVPRGVGILLASLGSIFCTVTSEGPLSMTSASLKLVPGTNRKCLMTVVSSKVTVHISGEWPTNEALTVQGPRLGNSIRYFPWASVVTPKRRFSSTNTAAPGKASPFVSDTLPESVNVSCPQSEALKIKPASINA